MVYTTEYPSPLGTITLACDEEAIIGLWFNGQRYFGSILPRQTERQERPLFQDARRWLDVYFSGRAPDHLPPLRYDSTPFRRQVCEIMLTIPYGSTMTYGQIAAAIGNKRLARVVGYALHVNPEPGVIPCHRVVKRDGEVSSAFAFGGANRQVELLKAEGVGFLDDSHVDMKHCCVRALPLILEE